jgi:hypothetical protein
MLPLLLAALLPQTPPPPAVHFAKPRLVANGWPDADAIALLADVDGDGFGDLIALHVGGAGSLEFAHNVHGGKFGTGAIGVRLPEGGSLTPLQSVQLHRCKDKPPRLWLLRSDGVAYAVGKDDKGYLLAPPVAGDEPADVAVQTLWQKDDSALRGDFDGDGRQDTIADGKLVLAADPTHPIDVPCLRDLPPRARVVAGDFQGDHKDDLLVLREDDTYRLGRDVSVYLSYFETDTDWDGDGLSNEREAALKTDPLDADTDHDGLLDGWEVLGEGGLDLPALGASPTHKDCICFVQRYDNTDGATARLEIDRAVQYWAGLPVKNPDGAKGIRLLPIWLGPLPAKQGVRSWWELGDENLPVPARGLAHYMIVSQGGGGQSSELGDMGGCGDHALYATFLHEFGHQVGLSHSGAQAPGGSPIYTSLMNYSYSYGFNDDYNQIHYSNGELAALQLDEHLLPERVPVPFDKLSFLTKGPYRFRLKADGDGTWVDWNRNGVFDQGPVCANITDTYGVNGGQRFPLGRTFAAPSLAVHKDKLLLFTVDKDHHLASRCNLDEGKWTEPVAMTQVEATGDPWAIAAGDQLLVLVPTAPGVALLAADDAAALATASPTLLPDTAGCAVSAVQFRGRLLALLWTSPQAPLRFAERAADGTFATPRAIADLRSEMAVGAVEDPRSGELCVAGAAVEKDDKGEHRRWQLTRLLPADDGGFRIASAKHPGGKASGWAGNARPVLLREDAPPNENRLHLIGPGWLTAGSSSCSHEAITIGDVEQNEGWRLRRFYDEWTTTRLPLGACWHRGDLVLAFAWAQTPGADNDAVVHVSHHGLGLCSGALTDFDDITSIAEVGLAHSLAWRRGSVQ